MYILLQTPHNKVMENTTTIKTKQKKNNPMKKLGKTIQKTFIEMSSSLAGWIDDTGNQFSGKKQPKNTSVSQAKFAPHPPEKQ